MFLKRVPETLRALRHRNYRLFISGQVISLIGAWMQSTAQGWLVYRLTGDPFLLGLVGFAGQVPILALGLFAGVVTDSANRHRLLIFTQGLLMLQAMLMALLTFVTGADGQPIISFYHILMLATFSGVVAAFDLPARQAFLTQMVPQRDVGNAVALNSLTFNLARIIGPAAAGLIIYGLSRLNRENPLFGEGVCFMINSVTFLATIVQLLRMKVTSPAARTAGKSTQSSLTEGLNYIYDRRHIRALMFFVGMMAIFGLPYLTLLPVFAKDVLGGDERTFSMITASVGAGAMVGGILMARRKKVEGLGGLITNTTFGFAAAIILFSWLRSTTLACVALTLAGLCMVSTMIAAQTLVQTLVAEAFRGRVMSFYTMMAVGLMPFGSLIAGAEAKHFGAPVALTINGIVCLATAAVFLVQLPELRRLARSSPEYKQAILGE